MGVQTTDQSAKNEALENALSMYRDIEADYIAELEASGVAFAPRDDERQERAKLLRQLEERGARVRNGGASVALGRLSPGCVACTDSCVSRTFIITNDCHRNCYFCFNPNQVDYSYYCDHDAPWRKELEDLRSSVNLETVHAIALTGGEPMLRPKETYAFFQLARKLFPQAHLRLYTSGDLLDKEALVELREAGLDEVRFSVKQEDEGPVLEKVLLNMEMAHTIIPSVMVEMPIVPGTEDQMHDLLRRLNDIGVDAINFLEFAYALWNWEAFSERGFVLKNPPFEVLYDYSYAGSLAVQGSEELSLKLMIWAYDQGFSYGIHYCSLENKHRSQIREENEPYAFLNRCYAFDYNDFFLKTAVVYGAECERVEAELRALGCKDFIWDYDAPSLSFPPRWLAAASKLRCSDGSMVQPWVSYNVVTKSGGNLCFRELKLVSGDVAPCMKLADDREQEP